VHPPLSPLDNAFHLFFTTLLVKIVLKIVGIISLKPMKRKDQQPFMHVHSGLQTAHWILDDELVPHRVSQHFEQKA
jgi:hypothetical protein